jgi:hypothetical protein
MNETHGKWARGVLSAWGITVCSVSCWSSDEAAAGGRVEHPQHRIPAPAASVETAHDAGPPSQEGPFSQLDKAIADDCLMLPGLGPALPRAWSQHVPERDCTDDDECGDGFCDRGRCAAIWTCRERYGQRCDEHGFAAPSRSGPPEKCLCVEGRCRSCLSDAECVEAFGVRHPGAAKLVCSTDRERSGHRGCGSLWINQH